MFTLDEASEALQHLSTGTHIGKVVVLNRARRERLMGTIPPSSSSSSAEREPRMRVVVGKQASAPEQIPFVHSVVQELTKLTALAIVPLQEFLRGVISGHGSP